MAVSLRKRVIQLGVILLVAQQLGESIGYVLFLVPGSIVVFLVVSSGIFVLLGAAVWPSSESDTWGSMWPLMGYDNTIDAIYSRGPWMTRFQELEEAEAERRVVESMALWFE